MKYKQNTTVITAILCIICLLSSAQAFAGRNHSSSAIEVEVISDNRGNLRKHSAKRYGNSRHRSYVVARNNERYTIRIRNNSGERVGVVIAVDGRNIISGRKSHLQAREKMYVLQPYASAEYSGWRTRRNGVNRFFFTNMDNSYSAAWGDYSAMGIIAVAAFPERYQRGHGQYRDGRKNHQKRSHSARKFGNSMGTGFGEEQWSPSHRVHFVAEQHPMTREFIKYERRSSLCHRGVVRCRPHKKRRGHGRQDNWDFAPYPDQIWGRFSQFNSFLMK